MLYLLLGDSEVYNIVAHTKYQLMLNLIIKDTWDAHCKNLQFPIWYNNRTFNKFNHGVPYVMQYHKNVIGCLDRNKYCITRGCIFSF